MRKPKPRANTFLTHLLGQGLADERYEVRRFRSTAGGGIRPVPAGESGGPGIWTSRADVTLVKARAARLKRELLQ